MVNIDFICKGLFTYYYKKLYRKPCPMHVSECEKAINAYSNFGESVRKKYNGSVGVEYIWNYALYQFGRYLEKIKAGTVGFNGTITPAMIFGKKAYEVFSKRRVEMDFITSTNPLITEYKVSIDEFRKLAGLVVKKPTLDHKTIVDNVKAIAVSGPDPLIICVDMTDLYHPLDRSCKICPDKEECKKALEELYPKVFKERSPL